MSTHTHTLASTGTLTNPGMLAMRAANMCKRLGLQARDAGTAAPKPAKAAKPARATAPAPAKRGDAPDADEPTAQYRVCLLVKAGDGALTHVCSEHTSAGPRRAGKQARIAALAAGHTPVGVVATVREDAPGPVWASVAP